MSLATAAPRIAWIKHRTKWLSEARPKQLLSDPTVDIWLTLAGRGFGKTRLMAEHFSDILWNNPGFICNVVAPTTGDIRGVIYEGESGLLNVIPPECIVKNGYNKQLGSLELVNGSIFRGFSAEAPERLRGPQCHCLWGEEWAAWENVKPGNTDYTTDMALFGARLGKHVRVGFSTTPKPVKIIKAVVEAYHEKWNEESLKYKDFKILVTHGHTTENYDNLASNFKKMLRKYEGTRIGRQELNAELLFDVQGALWASGDIDRARMHGAVPDLVEIVVAVDPAITHGEGSDETGIVVVGRDSEGQGYVLEDLSGKYSPNEWARVAYDAYRFHMADYIVGEVNQGGDMVEAVIKAEANANGANSVPVFRKVWATRGKAVRAQPISMLYEQGRVSHVGLHAKLEDEMVSFVPDGKGGVGGASPNRVDALVWGMTKLFIAARKQRLVIDL